MIFLVLPIIIIPLLVGFLCVGRTDKNSEIHSAYLKQISAINGREIDNHIYNWEWRYDWIRKCYRSVCWWKFWQSIEEAYVDSDKVLREQTPEDMIPTYIIIPDYIKERS